MSAARHTIYIENQYVEVPEIVTALHTALSRGVAVVLLLPAVPDRSASAVTPQRQAFLALRARLAAYDHFMLCGIAGLGVDGLRKPVYVHAKLMLIDDTWATIGSCNLHHYSLVGNGELNVAFQDASSVRALRVALFQEHLATDTSAMDAAGALRLFRQIADANRQRHARSDPHWQGFAFRLDIRTYGQEAQF
jgi:cardiolipin synthase A/B